MTNLTYDVTPAILASDSAETSLWTRTVCNDDHDYTREMTFLYNQSTKAYDTVVMTVDESNTYTDKRTISSHKNRGGLSLDSSVLGKS